MSFKSSHQSNTRKFQDIVKEGRHKIIGFIDWTPTFKDVEKEHRSNTFMGREREVKAKKTADILNEKIKECVLCDFLKIEAKSIGPICLIS